MQRYKVFQIIQVFGMIIGEAVAAYSDAATIYHFPILGDSSHGFLFGLLIFFGFVFWYVLSTTWRIKPKIEVDSIQEFEISINPRKQKVA